MVAKIDDSLCIRCNKCFIACEDSAHQAIDIVAPPAGSKYKHSVVVDEEECVGCNLCVEVCPVDNCIELIPIDTGEESITWNEMEKQNA